MLPVLLNRRSKSGAVVPSISDNGSAFFDWAGSPEDFSLILHWTGPNLSEITTLEFFWQVGVASPVSFGTVIPTDYTWNGLTIPSTGIASGTFIDITYTIDGTYSGTLVTLVAPSPSPTPEFMSGLRGWYRQNTWATSGSDVTSWPDAASVMGALTASGSTAPQAATNKIVLSNDCFNGTYSPGTGGFFFVCRLRITQAGWWPILDNFPAQANGTPGSITLWVKNDRTIEFLGGAVSGGCTSTTALTLNTTYNLMVWVGTTGGNIIWIDGVQEATGTGNRTLANFNVFCRPPSTGAYAEIFEMVAATALPSNDRISQLNTYLNTLP